MARLQKIKHKLKKIIKKPQRKKIVAGRRRIVSRIKPKKAPQKTKKEILGGQEIQVEKAKFSASEAVRVTHRMPQMQELPYAYAEDRIVLQIRDTSWIHAYWEVRHETLDRLKAQTGDLFFSAKRMLRVYDVTDIIFDGANAHKFFDIEVGEANNWYINTAGPGRSWCVDLGLLLADNRFITIVRSNTVCMPLEGPSWVTDEEWMIPDDMFARLYGMGFGLRFSSPPGKAWQERIKKELFSGVLASPGIASMASPVKKPLEKKFWLVVNTELIVYGATEPGAKVTVQGNPIRLRNDGTFTLRYALPDGKQVIPVLAQSSDGSEERGITPIVAKETK